MNSDKPGILRAITGVLLLVASGPLMAADDRCSLTIEGDDQMQFDKDEMTAPADCAEVTVTMKHVGELPRSAMGHNWVLTLPADMQPVVSAGAKAGLDKGYLPPKSDKVIAATDLVGGGKTTTVTFKTDDLEAGKDYRFFCSFPGHSATMRGTFRLE